MNYKLDTGAWSSVFAVPSEVVDKHLKLAGKEQLKVILFLLRHGGVSFSIKQISDSVGISKELAEDSVEYWVQNGLLKQTNDALLPAGDTAVSSAKDSSTEENTAPKSDKSKSDETKKNHKTIRPDGLHVATRINESKEIKMLMQETENTLGKTISPTLSSALIILHDDYGLPVEVIVMIINYAKSIGKSSTYYIEKVGKDWSENGIVTMRDAEKKLQELDKARMLWKKLKPILGVENDVPTPKQEEYALTWLDEWNLKLELIEEAVNRCIDSKGKLSMAYVNGILTRWQASGVSSKDELEAFEEKKADKAKPHSKSYDIDELEDTLFNILLD